MAKVSNYTQTRIELLYKQGLRPAGILRSLKSEGLLVSLQSVSRIIKKLQTTGSMADLPRSRKKENRKNNKQNREDLNLNIDLFWIKFKHFVVGV